MRNAMAGRVPAPPRRIYAHGDSLRVCGSNAIPSSYCYSLKVERDMMLRIKSGLLISSVALVAVLGYTASNASAYEWWVKNATLEGKSENLAFTIQTPIEFKTSKVTVSCAKATGTGGFIRNKLELQWTQLKLETCSVPRKAECTVKAGEVAFAKAEGLLELNGFVKILHPAGTEFAAFKIEGAGCAIAANYTILANGTLVVRLQEPEFEANAKVFEMEATDSRLILEPGSEEILPISGALTATAESFKYRVKNAGCPSM
jgi:hypothetical protein